MVAPPKHQIPGVYHRRIGEIVVTALSDGYLDSPLDMLRNITVEESSRMLRAAFRPELPGIPGGGRRTSVNCYAIHSAGRLALIDTGSGSYLLPTAGRLMQNLVAAGIDPAAVERVILTHMHPDHSAGLTEMPSGRRNFPNAELVVHENEPRHWNDDAAMARAEERAKRLYFGAAREQMAPYGDRLKTFSGPDEVFPGVTAMPLTGHTPGHTGYMIESGGARLLIWGDICHVPEIQIPRPEVTIAFDTDPEAAEATRRRVLEMVAAERLLIAGMHVHFPGFAHVGRTETGYTLVPEAWDQAL
ncbi:MAG TPA: MBL fold metallo-hydrolase [Acetobacteraceae bacterium]|nr:MBL fold metallo-hydrolase [Acetobacteraceae bacterium]